MRSLARLGAPDDLAIATNLDLGLYISYFVVTSICTIFLLWTAVSSSVMSLFSCMHVDKDPSKSPIPSPVAGYLLLQARPPLLARRSGHVSTPAISAKSTQRWPAARAFFRPAPAGPLCRCRT